MTASTLHASTIFSALLFTLLFSSSLTSSSDYDDHRRTYIVHMDDSKSIQQQQQQFNTPNHRYQTILNSITKSSSSSSSTDHHQDDEDLEEQGSAPELLYTYETTITGFAAKLTGKQRRSLSQISGVLSIFPDEMLSLHTTYSTRFLGLEPGRGLWNATSLAGDVIIGVLDTGVWPEHVSFRDLGFPRVPARWRGECEAGANFSQRSCNRKLIGARAFLKGYEAINGRINGSEEFRSARDSNGHGTHTASTAAGTTVHGASLFGMAEGVASGMRFTSRIAAYKVCWQAGCASSDILAAIDRAVEDGVDVLSLSLGGLPRPYYRDSMAIAAFGAVQKGVFMSCSAGNSGPVPSTVGNMAPWMMTVAASYIDRTFPGVVKLSNGKTFKGSSLYSAVKKRTKQLPLVYKDTAGGRRSEFCVNGSLTPSLVKGKIVICERGLNSRTEKGFVVKSAGGAGMLLLNSPAQGEELFADAHVLPAATLGASAAKAIKGYLRVSKNLTASITFLGTQYGARAPIVAAFSSRGPSIVDPYVIKPDITAPGVNILAAWPPITPPTELENDKRRVLFNIISGTSMSCPHLSGIAALIKSVHKDWSPAAIKSAIMTSAYTHDNRGHLISDAFVSSSTRFATPFAFGSGHVHPEAASDPGLIYDITGSDYLHYLCSINYTDSQVTLLARRNYTCPSSRLEPGDLNYPSFAVNFDGANRGNTTFTYKRIVTNVGHAKISYKVIIEKPKGIKVSVKPKILKFTRLNEKKTYKVRITGSGAKIRARGISSFGSLTWVGGKYRVRSPIAVVWQ